MRRPILRTFATLFALAASTAGAQQLHFSTENDLFTNESSRDDLYTFSVALGAEIGGYAVTLRENAFTDRAAGIRFDETYLSLGHPIALPGPWSTTVEAGLAHRGRGIFGESAQNAVHRAIGGEEVHLRYLGDGLHLRLAFAAERRFAAGERFDWGPRFEADLAPGLRSWALVGAGATWRPIARLSVEMFAGGRFSDAAYEPLERHLAGAATAARLGVVFDERFYVSWSFNDFGDEREHLSAGYRISLDGLAGRRVR